MEKTIQLDQRELQQAQAIDQELMQAWAQIGVLSEQQKQAEKNRDKAIEKQKDLMQQALLARGIERHMGARPGTQAGTLIVILPDEAPPPPVEASKPNGAPRVLEVVPEA